MGCFDADCASTRYRGVRLQSSLHIGTMCQVRAGVAYKLDFDTQLPQGWELLEQTCVRDSVCAALVRSQSLEGGRAQLQHRGSSPHSLAVPRPANLRRAAR